MLLTVFTIKRTQVGKSENRGVFSPHFQPIFSRFSLHATGLRAIVTSDNVQKMSWAAIAAAEFGAAAPDQNTQGRCKQARRNKMNRYSHRLFVSTIRQWVGFVSLFGGALFWCLAASATHVETRQSTLPAGPLGSARLGHTATLLPDGKVLVVGGDNNGALDSAELYDPVTRTWSFTGNLNTARYWHTATLLPNGKVLVAGSYNNSARNSAELYDSATGKWTYTDSLNTAGGGTATLLPNGKVLFVADYSAELYDPGTGTWSYTGNLNKAHGGGTATLLPNGKVLVMGGASPGVSKSAELYDPATGTWSIAGNLNTGRWYAHTATRLPNGMVLVAAGSEGGDDVLESAELYDAVTGTWSKTGDLNEDRGAHTATLLPNGKVLVAGGFDYDYHDLDSAELYDPATGSWSYTGSLIGSRSGHTATLLTSGDVLVAGGASGGSILASTELFAMYASPLNYQGMWAVPNQAEAGWGINFNHQGDIVFGTLFTYDLDGAPLWLVMPAGALQSGTTYSGDLYRTTGPAFNAVPFTPITSANLTRVGSMTVTFSETGTATLTYTVNGISVTKSLQRQVYGSRAANCIPTSDSRVTLRNYQDLWWNPNESGWGVNITHQDRTLFATLFTYDTNGRNLWLVMPSGVLQADGSYLGELYRTSGPPFNAAPFTPITGANLSKVGTMSFRFTDGVTGAMTYTVNGIAVSKSITRLVFSSPVPSCS